MQYSELTMPSPRYSYARPCRVIHSSFEAAGSANVCASQAAASFVAVYRFDEVSNEWSRRDVEVHARYLQPIACPSASQFLPGRPERIAAIPVASRATEPSVPAAFVRSGDGLASALAGRPIYLPEGAERRAYRL